MNVKHAKWWIADVILAEDKYSCEEGICDEKVLKFEKWFWMVIDNLTDL